MSATEPHTWVCPLSDATVVARSAYRRHRSVQLLAARAIDWERVSGSQATRHGARAAEGQITAVIGYLVAWRTRPKMHTLLLVLLVWWVVAEGRTASERDEKGEDCYRAAQAAETEGGRSHQLALFSVFKTQAAHHRLAAQLMLAGAFAVGLLYSGEIVSEVRHLWGSAP